MKKGPSLFFVLLCLLCLYPSFSQWQYFDKKPLIKKIAQMPIQQEGRIKPLDTAARSFLFLSSSKTSLKQEQNVLYAPELFWLLLNNPHNISSVNFIRIDHPDILTLIDQTKSSKKLFSLQEIDPYKQKIRDLSLNSQKEGTDLQSAYQKKIMELHELLFLSYSYMNSLKVVDTENIQEEIKWLNVLTDPPSSMAKEKALETLKERYLFLKDASLLGFAPLSGKDDWGNFGDYFFERLETKESSKLFDYWSALSSISPKAPKEEALACAQKILDHFKVHHPLDYARTQAEYYFNLLSPFAILTNLYFLLFLFILFEYFIFNSSNKFNLYFNSYVFFTVFYILGLSVRMFIETRPPVTDLYSSALFIGLSSAVLGVFCYLRFRLKVFLLIACLLAALCLELSEHLKSSIDTFTPLRAVLDSNFWLATHVVIITIGYSITLLNACLSNFYILGCLFFSPDSLPSLKKISQSLYALILLALITSAVGTALGGVWADQSWGRFWGWDPKENGALMIVLWQALAIHAKKFGYISHKGLLVMTSWGAIITLWSWFGVNMLGVGLHTYGFMDQAFLALIFAVGFQLAIGFLGMKLKKTSS
jgi:ABC-type transport system involved in cytochrome c biogenesis permease subunit